MSQSSTIQLDVAPIDALIDQPIALRVSGLQPKQTLTLRSFIGDVFEARATFSADASGVVDVSQHAPTSGSYSGVDTTGLLWSLRHQDPDNMELPKPRADKPIKIGIQVLIDGDVIAETELTRHYMAENVTRTEIDEDGLRGVFFQPETTSPVPALMVLTGSGGGASETRAALLASHGYAAFALAYFNYPGLTDDLAKIPLEYFKQGAEWMQQQPGVDGARIGVTGGSRGGELSLILGATFPDIFNVVVAYVPSHVVWGGIEKNGGEKAVPSWMLNGAGLPFMPGREDSDQDWQPYIDAGEPIPLTPGFRKDVNAVDDLTPYTIPVEKIQGAVLLISGADDQMWPSAEFSDQVMARLQAHDFQYPYQHLRYENAGHFITTPITPATIKYSKHPLVPVNFDFGGEPNAQAHANADSWANVLRFLEENL